MELKRQQPKICKTWTLDSTRWDYYHPRDGDIIIATYPKCGTTWMQQIVSLLIFQSPEPRPIPHISPWIDCRFRDSVEVMQALLEGQRHRRFLKSHLPFDSLPHYDHVRYIHVARDGRDAFMSLVNHWAGFTPVGFQALDRAAEEMGGPAPRPPHDPRIFWREWLTKGVLPGETDGYLGPSYFNLEATYWRARSAPHVLLVHFNDLKADLEGEMRRVAEFLGLDPLRDVWPALVDAASFAAMKRNGKALLPGFDQVLDEGSERFLFQGTNGRWHEVMTAEDLALYDQVATRLTPGLARWLQKGRLGAGDPRTALD